MDTLAALLRRPLTLHPTPTGFRVWSWQHPRTICLRDDSFLTERGQGCWRLRSPAWGLQMLVTEFTCPVVARAVTGNGCQCKPVEECEFVWVTVTWGTEDSERERVCVGGGAGGPYEHGYTSVKASKHGCESSVRASGWCECVCACPGKKKPCAPS